MASRCTKITDLSNELILNVVSNLRGPDKVCCALSNRLFYNLIKHQVKAQGFHRLDDLCPKLIDPFLDLSGNTRFEELMRRLVLWMPEVDLRHTLMNTVIGLNALQHISEWPKKGHSTRHYRDTALMMVKWQAQFEDKHEKAVKRLQVKVNNAGLEYHGVVLLCWNRRKYGS